MYSVLFLVLFICLLFLSRLLTSTISLFFTKLTKSHTAAIQLLAILFLPGVIIHELAHWLVASVLFVPTGNIEFMPQVQGNSVKLGSVQIALTDPVRRFCIGIAPVICGLMVLLGLFWFLSPPVFPLTWKGYVFFYAIFEIGNTMFSSSKDLEGVVGFLILAFLFFALLFFLHVPLVSILTNLMYTAEVQTLFKTLALFSLFAIGIDTLCVGVLRIILYSLR